MEVDALGWCDEDPLDNWEDEEEVRITDESQVASLPPASAMDEYNVLHSQTNSPAQPPMINPINAQPIPPLTVSHTSTPPLPPHPLEHEHRVYDSDQEVEIIMRGSLEDLGEAQEGQEVHNEAPLPPPPPPEISYQPPLVESAWTLPPPPPAPPSQVGVVTPAIPTMPKV